MVELNVLSKRLMRELKEIEVCPVPHICICPVGEGNLEEWHGNIRGDPGCPNWGSVVLHFKVLIPTSYPVNPPRVILSTFFPHINVVRRRGEWEVCLDMLESAGSSLGPQLTLKYRYWSSAYTVRSILVQLRSFLLADGQRLSTAEGGILRVVEEARNFSCPHEGCSHRFHKVHPQFPTEEDVEAAPFSYPFIKISGEIGAARMSKYAELSTCSEALLDSSDDDSLKSTSALSNLKTNDMPEEEWTIVGKKKQFSTQLCSKSCATVAAQVVQQSLPTMAPVSGNMYSMIQDAEFAHCNECGLEKMKSSFSSTAWKRLGNGSEIHCLACNSRKEETNVSAEPSAVANMNFRRREKKRMQDRERQKLISSNSDTYSDITSVESGSLSKVSFLDRASPTIKAAGLLTRLPRDIVIGCGTSSGLANKATGIAVDGICSYLSLKDILSLGQTCKSVHLQLDSDWWLWRDLFLRRFGKNSALIPTGSHAGELKQAWKYAYLLQANCLTDDLQCYHMRLTSSDPGTILGVPLDYTINPKTGLLDYVTSTFDIISYAAYSTYGVRRTVWGEKFQSFLPLYIDEQHFMRGMNRLITVGVHLMTPKHTDTPPRRQYGSKYSQTREFRRGESKPVELEDLWTPKSPPEMVMALLVKMMNTQVVLLCDNGISASESALTGYCQLHRLMLAFSGKFPKLRRQADRRLEAFIRDPRRRLKQYTASLGDLICMLTISERYQWKDIAMLYLLESFDRAVLWSCTKDNTLINLPKGDMSRLDKFMAAHAVGLRLCLFHAVFLDILVNTATTSSNRLRECEARYDIFLGRPPLHTRRRWHAAVKSILELNSWPQFFAIGRFPKIPSPQQLLVALEGAVQNSLTKGYHNSKTKFENVMKSGVSRILLKGNSYTVDPGVKNLKLCERWNFDGATVYLDASCLIYDFNGSLIGIVDYSHLNWCSKLAKDFRGFNILEDEVPRVVRHVSRSPQPVVHSGDVIRNGVGEHTIDVNLAIMPANVCSLVFTVSAWMTSLVDIQRPSAHLFDVNADTELCSYQFEDRDTGDNTAVVMCKLQRCSAATRWEMTSIGHVGMGRADDYKCLLQDIIEKGILNPKPLQN